MSLGVLAYDMAAYSNYEKRVLEEIERINAFRDRADTQYDSILESHHAEIRRILEDSRSK